MQMAFVWAGHVTRIQVPGAKPSLIRYMDAGLSIGELQRFVQTGKELGGMDRGTQEWVAKLVAPPVDPALMSPRVYHRCRRDAFKGMWLVAGCPVLRLPGPEDLAEFADIWNNVSLDDVMRWYQSILDHEIDANGPLVPLTEAELGVIGEADARYPRGAQWRDVCAALPGRSFAQVVLQTTGYTRGMRW
ncbi:hypothetical protein EV175_006910 [Coemansia sp. RSA 1933]|nr:hypothetical protein EV175_006910 [Coemansia sp. RSA 1933]